MPPDKKLTKQERGEKFQAEYAKLCEKWQCQHVSFPIPRREGKIVIVETETQVAVGDE